MPTFLMEEAAGPETDSGDACFVDGRLFTLRKALSTGRGRIRAYLEEAEASYADWMDACGITRSGKVFIVASAGPDGLLQVQPGDVVVALTQVGTMSAIPDGASIKTNDEGGRFEVLARSEWAAGWTRLSMKCVG